MVRSHPLPSIQEMKFFRYSATLLFMVMALLTLSAQPLEAAVTITFSQSGADTVVSATGNLNLTGMSWTDRVEHGTGEPILYQQLAGNVPQDIVRLLSMGFDMYRMPIGTDFFGDRFGVLVASQSFGQTFGIWSDGTETCLYVPARFTSGTLSGTMVFAGVELASLGLIEQDVSFGASEDKTVRLRVIPEASSLGLVALGAAVLLSGRSRHSLT